MAAIGSIPTGSDEPTPRDGSILNILRVAILAILVGCTIYILAAHREWFDDPRLLKREVISWGARGPIIYVLLYAVGPSFLIPGAVMTIAAGLAFGM